MEQNEMIDIHNIIMKTLKIVPKSFDMDNQNFNCDCHMELTQRTYELVGNRFGKSTEDGKKIVDEYFILTDGNI